MPTWNGNLLTNNLQMQQILSYTQTLPALIVVVYIFKGDGFIMTGNHISSFQNRCPSNGKNSLQLSQQPSLGATLGGKSTSDSTVIILRLFFAREGKSFKHPRIMPLLHTFFSQQQKITFTVSLKHLPGKTNEIADALSRKQFIRFFHLAPQAEQLPTPIPGMLTKLNCKISCP